MGSRMVALDAPVRKDGTIGATTGDSRKPEESCARPLLSIYLREMGATPLLQRDREQELSRELQEAREALAGLALRLPQDCKDHVLEGDPARPRLGRAWPLDEVETFYSRLVCHQRERDDPGLAGLVREAAVHKRRLDRARDSLILANLRLVVHLAKRFSNQGIPFMDLIQEGNIGLMRAVEKFEYERGNRFSTYAYWWVKQAIQRAIAEKARMIRIPVHASEKIKKIGGVTGQLVKTLGRRPTPREIAEEIRMPVEAVEELQGLQVEDLASTDEPLSLLQFVADPKAVDPFELTRKQELREKVRHVLEVLAPREEKIIRMRFGLGRDRSYTLGEISSTLRLSRERVRQIEVIALRKLQAAQEILDLRKLAG